MGFSGRHDKKKIKTGREFELELAVDFPTDILSIEQDGSGPALEKQKKI